MTSGGPEDIGKTSHSDDGVERGWTGLTYEIHGN